MLNSPALKILSSFSQQELKDFKEFIRSPFFNKNENIVSLYDFLRKFYPDFKDEKLEKENLYKRLFGQGEYNDGFMRTLIFSLNNLLENYLVYVNSSKDKVKQGISLLNEINERKIEKIFLKNFKAIEEANETGEKDPGYFMNKYNLTIARETYNLWNKSEYKSDLDEIFKNSHDNLTFFYLGSILREYRYLLYRNDLVPSGFQSEFLEHILEFLSKKKNLYIENPFIEVHLNEIYLQKEKSDKHFYILKEILKNNAGKLSYADRFSLQNILQIYCIKKIFEGNNNFVNERFELFEITLSQKLYSAISEKYFEDTLFINIVNLGVSLNKFDWVRNIIEQFKNMLSPNNKNTIVNYSYAKLNFGLKKFDEALGFLNSIVNVKHKLLKFPLRTLTLMTLYELNLMTKIFYDVDSYRHYLSKNKGTISEERFERIGNFVKYLNKLIKLKEKMNKSSALSLKKELELTHNIIERNWLLQKVKELK